MKEFDSLTYKNQKGSFNNEDEQLLLSLLLGVKGDILDIGCGDGTLTTKVKDAAPTSAIIAIDNSPEQISLASKSAEGITFKYEDVCTFSPSIKFDTAYSFYAFPHIPKSNLQSAFGSVRKLLKKGGRFYLFTNICLFDTSIASTEEQEACDIVFLDHWPSQINLVSLEEIRRIFTAEGFDEINNMQRKTGADIKSYGRMVSWLFTLQ